MQVINLLNQNVITVLKKQREKTKRKKYYELEQVRFIMTFPQWRNPRFALGNFGIL